MAQSNFATSLLANRPAWVRTARVLSAAVGIGGWAALVFATGGLASPFIARLWLEIVLSALIFPPAGTLLVTGVVAGALWILAGGAGGRFEWERLWLQTGFVGVIGAVTFLASKGWEQAERRMASRAADLDNRLRDLEVELDDARELGQLGEGAARFAHGLKGAVHSLRGFTKLMEGAQLDSDSRAKVDRPAAAVRAR